MTIPSTPRKAGPFTGNGVTTSFPFSFKVFAPTDVKVVIANSAGVETVLVLNSDYSVSLNANQDTSPGGTITYPISGSPLPSGSRLTIVGNIDYDQPLDLPPGGNFSPLALENQLDRTVMQVQQLAEIVGRSVSLPVTAAASTRLPAPEANKFLAWDSTGTALVNAGAGGGNSIDGPFLLLDNTITDDFTVPTGKNALSISPTIAAGVTVTVPPGSEWVTLDSSSSGGGGGGGGGGVTDHGALTGLTDDDHPQYLNNARGDARYAQISHAHTISNITGLQTALDGKAAATHTHTISDVGGLQTALDGKQSVLVSGTNIKTINGQSLLGSGDIAISGTGTFGSAVQTFDGGETANTFGSNSIGRNNPLRTASANSLLKIGHGTPASPVSANSPAVWQESWVTTDYTALGDGGQFAQGVAGALFQTFKTGGTGGVNGVISYARSDSNTAGDIIGLRGIADGKDRSTGGPSTFCGIWAEVESPSTNYGFGCYGIEINAFTNYSGSSFAQDPFTSGGGKVTGLLVNNFQKAGTPGAFKNHFGIAVTSITGTTRALGYFTGLYIADCDNHSIRLFGGARTGDGATATSTATQVGIEVQGMHQTGINFATPCMIPSGTRGHAIQINDNRIGLGNYTGSDFANGDLWANTGTGQHLLFFRRGNINTEVMCSQGVGTSGSYAGDRKIAVNISGTTYYLIASTSP
jgi:hypothetical protein